MLGEELRQILTMSWNDISTCFASNAQEILAVTVLSKTIAFRFFHEKRRNLAKNIILYQVPLRFILFDTQAAYPERAGLTSILVGQNYHPSSSEADGGTKQVLLQSLLATGQNLNR